MNACVETVPSRRSIELVAQAESAPARCISDRSPADFLRVPAALPPTTKRSWFPLRWLRARKTQAEQSFAAALPVAALPGVGHTYSRTLVERGVTTVGQLRRIPKPVLVAAFGKAIGKHIWECARSRDHESAARTSLA
jgi:hypothetical protein